MLAHLTTEVKLRLFENYEIDIKKFKAIGINLNILESIGSGIKFTLFHKLLFELSKCLVRNEMMGRFGLWYGLFLGWIGLLFRGMVPTSKDF